MSVYTGGTPTAVYDSGGRGSKRRYTSANSQAQVRGATIGGQPATTSSTRFAEEYARRRNEGTGPLLPGEAEYEYNQRLINPAFTNRSNPQPVVGSYGGEVFRREPVGGTPYFQVAQYWQYQSVPMSDAVDLYYQQPTWAQAEFQRAANEYNRVNQYNTTPQAIYRRMLAESKMLSSQGVNRTAVQILFDKFNDGTLAYGEDTSATGSSTSSGGGYSGGGGGGYGGGGYGGGASVGTVNLTNPEDARAVINQMALQMLGRTVTEREFKQYYKSLSELEMSTPQTVRMDVDADGNPVQVVEGGLGADARTAALQESLRGAKDYNEYTIGSQSVNLMTQYLQERGVFRG